MSELNKLRWRCRRGTLELDLLLLRYLEHAYLSAPPERQHAFLRVLDMEDVELMPYLMTDRLPADDSLAELVIAIRSLPAIQQTDESSATPDDISN
ncbi:succinate dehydrogenase assembly factor 2 [Methylomonas koyamae]|uniref:succinate dehydrogenase assembly factor 2 n=1 Tax=Methylomonas koyamae TaxID=702114 RepID=UPI0011282137|nr:succinate dehydrogenase assembly factor 2 [Methylomonas koyamae]TPQ24876.1 succinate dehydrogenase assembly factor 2 [Methylomonas koyamae]